MAVVSAHFSEAASDTKLPYMLQRSGIARSVWLFFAALQFALPGAVALADARLQQLARAPGAASHVESPDSKTCVPVHGPDCALCRHLSSARTNPPSPIALAITRRSVT